MFTYRHVGVLMATLNHTISEELPVVNHAKEFFIEDPIISSSSKMHEELFEFWTNREV